MQSKVSTGAGATRFRTVLPATRQRSSSSRVGRSPATPPDGHGLYIAIFCKNTINPLRSPYSKLQDRVRTPCHYIICFVCFVCFVLFVLFVLFGFVALSRLTVRPPFVNLPPLPLRTVSDTSPPPLPCGMVGRGGRGGRGGWRKGGPVRK